MNPFDHGIDNTATMAAAVVQLFPIALSCVEISRILLSSL